MCLFEFKGNGGYIHNDNFFKFDNYKLFLILLCNMELHLHFLCLFLCLLQRFYTNIIVIRIGCIPNIFK